MKKLKNYLVVMMALGLVGGMSALMTGCPDDDDDIDSIDDIGAVPAYQHTLPTPDIRIC